MSKNKKILILLVVTVLLIFVFFIQYRYAEISNGKIDKRLSYLDISKIRKEILSSEEGSTVGYAAPTVGYNFSIAQTLDDTCTYNDGKNSYQPFKNCQKNDVLILFFRNLGYQGGISQWYLLRKSGNKWNVVEKGDVLFSIS